MTGAEERTGPRQSVRAALLLVVEDSDTLRDVLALTLELCGYDVVCAGSAEEAIEVARRTPALDLAIIDVTLPGASGPWLVDELERESLVRSWVLMSGFPRSALGWIDGWRPSVDVVEKPFRLAALTDLVATRLQRLPG